MFSSDPSCHPLASVSNPLKVFLSRHRALQGPHPHLVCCFWNYRYTRKTSGMQFEALTSPDNVRNNLSKCLSFVFIKNRLVLTDSKNGGIMLSAQIVLSDHMQLLVVVMMTTNPFRRGHSLKQSQNTKGFHMGCSEKSTNMATSISSVFSSGAT